jgi:putative sterol carrier protein
MTAAEIVKGLPSRFIEEEAIGFEARVHLKLSGEGGGDFTAVIKDGTCTVMDGLEGEPDCTVSTKAKTYVATELGDTNPTMAVMTGKIKVTNIPVLTQFINCFERLK